MKCPWCVPTICYIGQFFRDRLAGFSDTLGIHKSIGQQCVGRITSEWYSKLLDWGTVVCASTKANSISQKKHHAVAPNCSHETNANILSQLSGTMIYGGGCSFQTVYSCCVKVSIHFSGELPWRISSLKLTENLPATGVKLLWIKHTQCCWGKKKKMV